MNEVLRDIVKKIEFSDDIRKGVQKLLLEYNRPRIAEHSLRVGDKAKALAVVFGVNEDLAEAAGLLHDIGGIFPNEERVEIARKLNIEVLPEEEEAPIILHQKISKVMAEEVFNIRDVGVLEAISCHTTLRANATKMDMILFIADKLEWDQTGNPPYLQQIEEQLRKSLELGAFTFLKFQWDNKENLKIIHPWLEAAYLDLKNKVRDENETIK